ncbi:MAG: hypothetical protein ACYDBT_12960 [Desulfobulbaceae bacterium]
MTWATGRLTKRLKRSKPMDAKTLSNLLIKVGGMLIIVLSISNIHSYVSAYSQYNERSVALFVSFVVIPNILPLLLGLFLFTRPGAISNRIVQDNLDNEALPSTTPLLQIEQICLSTLGFYLLFQSVSGLFFHTAAFIQAKSNTNFPGDIPNSLILTPEFIATLAELFFSLWLILKVRGIVHFINQLRRAGSKMDSPGKG